MSGDSAAFDHLIHWVGDLEGAATAYADAGLPVHDALAMDGFRNSAWGIDDERSVELATVTDWEAVTASTYAGSLEILKPAVDALAAGGRSGDGLITFAIDVADAAATAERLRAAGHEVDEAPVWFEDRGVGFLEVFVRDAPSYFPFFITYDPPRAELATMRAAYRQEHGIVPPPNPGDLAALLIRTPEPESEARLLGELSGCAVDGAVVRLSGGEVRFEQGAPAGLYGFVVRGVDVPGGEIEIAGVTVRSEPD
ncbi:VOC family protein [Gordonia iterans]